MDGEISEEEGCMTVLDRVFFCGCDAGFDNFEAFAMFHDFLIDCREL